METITIINKTMELADCKNDWFFDEKYGVWCLEDVLYTPCPTTPKFQRMSIFVPKAYMSAPGVIEPKGACGGYTSATAPVIFENNSAGYMQMPHVWLGGPRCFAEPYLAHGCVYVTCGNRGHESKDASGKFCGRAPINLVDLKMGIRFLRHNRAALPGDFDRIISVGWSAGGAMSSLLALSGDNPVFDPYLKESGAFLEESDAVFAAQLYCPVTDLEHADMAYEWTFAADKENEDSPAGPGGFMTPFAEAMSKELSAAYISYFNGLGLKSPDGTELTIGADGRSGSGYDYLLQKLSEAATVYLNKLQKGKLEVPYSLEDYMKGNYTYEKPAPTPGPGPDGPKPDGPMPDGPMPGGPMLGEPMPGGMPDKDPLANLRGFAGPGVDLGNPKNLPPEPPTLGDLVSRPPKGMERPPFAPPMMEVKGSDKASWLSWDGKTARVKDLDSYVLNQRRRMKPCTAFDVLGKGSGENQVYGDESTKAKHFSEDVAEAIGSLKDAFPAEYARFAPEYAGVASDAKQKKQKDLTNPYTFLKDPSASKQARHFRVRVGASDADTSFMVSLSLACAIENTGKDVDYALVWEMPHSEADYPGEILDWIDGLCK